MYFLPCNRLRSRLQPWNTSPGKKYFWVANTGGSGNYYLHSVLSVSYTHLDVYKRQDRATEIGAGIDFAYNVTGSEAFAMKEDSDGTWTLSNVFDLSLIHI